MEAKHFKRQINMGGGKLYIIGQTKKTNNPDNFWLKYADKKL